MSLFRCLFTKENLGLEEKKLEWDSHVGVEKNLKSIFHLTFISLCLCVRNGFCLAALRKMSAKKVGRSKQFLVT